MRLWGKVASGMSLVAAAVLVLVGSLMPETRPVSLAAAVLFLIVGLFGIPALVRLFMSFTGDEEVLQNGVAGSATITSAKKTPWHYNDYPIVQFSLSVEAGGAPMP